MRSVFSVLSMVFAIGVIGAGCGVAEPPADQFTQATHATQALQSEELSGDSQQVVCPLICGLGTQCRYRDGSCREACNPCLCEADGGKVVESCEQAACGHAICGRGTYCCNASCSICAPDGGFCTQQFCE